MKGKICPLPRAVSVQSDRDIEAQETAGKCCQNANMCSGAEEDNQGDNSTRELRKKKKKNTKCSPLPSASFTFEWGTNSQNIWHVTSLGKGARFGASGENRR